MIRLVEASRTRRRLKVFSNFDIDASQWRVS
jgi:hypothetical protein